MQVRIALKNKNSGLRLRVEKNFRQEFLDACRADGRVAADVLREFMRDYIAQNHASAQPDLFGASPSLLASCASE
jgi:hypothetical protein